jgi:hypothetical protein
MGLNNFGQLGDGTWGIRPSPVPITTCVAKIAAGGNHSMFMKTNGSLWAMGRNEFGQLGDGTTDDRAVPVQIAIGVIDMAAGVDHSLFLAAPTAPQIAIHPSPQTAAAGALVTFSAKAFGTETLRYQWRKNGTVIEGATATTLTLPNVQSSDAGSYSVEVTNDLGKAVSDGAALALARTFAGWAADNALTGASAQPSADPDSDGIDNLTEYALGLNPTKPDPTGSLPQLITENGHLVFQFTRPIWATEATIIVERSSDLETWVDITTATALRHTEGDRQTQGCVVPEGQDRVFLRLRVNRFPSPFLP